MKQSLLKYCLLVILALTSGEAWSSVPDSAKKQAPPAKSIQMGEHTPSLFTLLTRPAHAYVKHYYLARLDSVKADYDSLADWPQRFRYQLLSGNFESTWCIQKHTKDYDQVYANQTCAVIRFLNGEYVSGTGNASVALVRAENPGVLDSMLVLTGQYLSKYYSKQPEGAPVFAHFNAGFYFFLQDSLGWNPSYPVPALDKAIRVMMDIIMMQENPQPVWFELLGDLLQQHPVRFVGRWHAAMAYLRASMAAPDKYKADFRTKSIYALESNRLNPVNYNDKRFARFEKAFNEEYARGKRHAAIIAGLQKDGKAIPDSLLKQVEISDSMRNSFYAVYPPDTLLPLRLVMSSDFQLMEKRSQPMNPNEDLENVEMKKRVKSNVFFNFYAILIILMVVAAVVFFVRQVRKIDREYHGTGKDKLK